MPPRPTRAVAVAVEYQPLAMPIGQFPGYAAAVTMAVEPKAPASFKRALAIAGNVLAALVLIVGGAALIGFATLF